MKGFTKCENGHYYKEELASCPYCRGGQRPTEASNPKGETQLYTEQKDGNKTRIVLPKTPEQQSNRTVFGDKVKGGYRSSRKLVGWLVSYSFDPLGADFRLYEGRNEIGRDAACNITVPDKTMSGRHATILFKNDKFKIKDELSSHGTLVNDADIEDDTVELHDGDVIKMGETVFKFKTTV
jgi:hypothetical protein